MSTETPAFTCGVCAANEPTWRIDRRGDAAVSWACDDHLAQECTAMQRDWEVSELVVILAQKAREWSSIGAALEKTAVGEVHYRDLTGRAACGDLEADRLADYLELVECAACRRASARARFGDGGVSGV
jgi:hypothetical protein